MSACISHMFIIQNVTTCCPAPWWKAASSQPHLRSRAAPRVFKFWRGVFKRLCPRILHKENYPESRVFCVGGHFGLLKASVALPNLHRICDPKLQGAVTPWSFKAYRAGPPAPAVGNHASVQRPSCRTPTLKCFKKNLFVTCSPYWSCAPCARVCMHEASNKATLEMAFN